MWPAISQSEDIIGPSDQSEAGIASVRCYQSSMGPQQGPVDSPHTQLGVISSPVLSRPRDLEEVTSPELSAAPINLYISEAGDYNHSVSGQCRGH